MGRAAAAAGIASRTKCHGHTLLWNCLRKLAQLAGRLSVDELLRAALERTGYLATLTGLPDGHRRRGNVEKLVEKAAESGALHFTDFEAILGEFNARVSCARARRRWRPMARLP